jgi:cobyrinic acid a,c-diamide synthase
MGALSSSGLKVQGFKIGPDFIDPSYHTAVTDVKSRNLDTWMLPEKTNLAVFQQNVAGCDIAVIEGVMGLFDEADGMGRKGSTAYMAEFLRSPVILVLDVWGMARSAAAIAAGCKGLDNKLNIAGVILNRVSGEKHGKLCKVAIESTTGIPVVGALPRNPDIKLPERHLGLVPTKENPDLNGRLEKISEFVKANVDLERILEIGKSAPPLREVRVKSIERKKLVKIGVAYDEAFNFYYQDALDTLAAMGAEVTQFSPIHDKQISEEFDGLYIGGGFPEISAKELELNQSMRSAVKRKAEQGMPIFAECGGLMYLTKAITDLEQTRHSMVALLDCETQMVRKLTLNYTYAKVLKENILSKPGDSIKGHEFHFSRLNEVPSDTEFAYVMKRGSGVDSGKDGWIEYSSLAQYMHLSFAAFPRSASNFVGACLRYKHK